MRGTGYICVTLNAGSILVPVLFESTRFNLQGDLLFLYRFLTCLLGMAFKAHGLGRKNPLIRFYVGTTVAVQAETFLTVNEGTDHFCLFSVPHRAGKSARSDKQDKSNDLIQQQE
jgi:hypothetical protein